MGTPSRTHRSARLLAGLSLVLVLAACGDSDGEGDDSPTTAASQAGSEAAVTAVGFAFDPQTLTVASGSTVVWTNQDGAEHTVVGTGGISGQLAPGGSYEQVFDVAGTFTYACTIHPSMTGTITVT
jgi:plastocyanin